MVLLPIGNAVSDRSASGQLWKLSMYHLTRQELKDKIYSGTCH